MSIIQIRQNKYYDVVKVPIDMNCYIKEMQRSEENIHYMSNLYTHFITKIKPKMYWIDICITFALYCKNYTIEIKYS